MLKTYRFPIVILFLLFISSSQVYAFQASDKGKADVLSLENVFDLEYATDPQISPKGDQVVYVRNFMDKMKDRRRSNLWIINTDGSRHRALTSGNKNNFSPRWSPSGDRLLFASTLEGGGVELYIRWMDTGETAKITNLDQSPGGLSWSPDGKQIAFTMFVPKHEPPMVSLPGKPQGAEWAKPAQVIDKLKYRADGAGYLKNGYRQVFVMPANGSTPRQITHGDYNHGGSPQWTPDGKFLVISANRHKDWEYNPANSEIYKISVDDGTITALTDRKGPDGNPVISPDGKYIAYTGFDDKYLGYQISHLYLMNADGSGKKEISGGFEYNIQNPRWSNSGDGLYFQYDKEGNTKVGFISLSGKVEQLADNLGGTSVGRPYGGGSYTVAPNGTFAYTYSTPSYPADIAVGSRNEKPTRISMLNDDVFGHKTLGKVQEIWYESSYDGQRIQGWIVTPPNFDPEKKYPMVLEIHGGPFANYGDRFSAEIQLYAAAGYVVLYTNPRGSTSYGQKFGNLIHHDYPDHDYEDLMSGVDAVLKKGYVDKDHLYVTGGSGGGVLTAWIVGKTDRFKAAVVAKPVINWYSFVLTADNPAFFYKYWFPGLPWNHLENYMRRSPITYAGNVTTPTMVMGGTKDYRTPPSEAEQFYTAIKLKKVDAVLVRIPGAGHHITERPSQMMEKVAYILKWFEMHK